MADSAGIIPSKNSEKSKLSNSINRTTSETLRLTDTERVLNQPNSLTSSTPRKKTSFIITSITSRTSNDAGEDSADDLDESHTEDISEIVDNSRVTDIENETPSYSEDTFSKDDVFFNASSSLVSAPVIPTSSQYGLALVPTSENSENILNPSDSSEHSENPDLRVEVNESVINLGVVSTKHDPEMRDMHPPAPRTERFKVVKIESTEPFKRGRWICMDYLDHPNIAQTASINNTKSDSECSPHPPSEASDSVSITNSAASVVAAVNLGEDPKQQNLTNINNIINSEVSNQLTMQPSDNGQLVNNQQTMPISTPSNIPTNYSSVSPGQSLQSNLQMSQPLVNSSAAAQPPQPQQQAQSQSLSQAHIQQILANSNTHTSLQPQQIQQVLASSAMPQQAQQAVPTPQQPPQQAPQQPPQQGQQQQQMPAQQSMPSQQSMPQQPQQQQQQPQQMMQPQGMPQQMPAMPQYQPQAQPTMAQQQQQQYQPMQQQQQQAQMMQQQMQPQQNMQPQMPTVQQVHMQPNVQQNMQQMPMQQQQGQQPQIMPQQMQQLAQQMPQQVSYSQPLPQNQPSGVTQTSSQGMMPTMHPQMQNYQPNQMLSNMQPQPIMNIQSQPHLQPQYYTNPMQQTGMMNSQGGMMPSLSQSGTVGQVNMQSSSTLPPLQSYPVSQPIQGVPGMQTPPVQTSMPQYTLPMSMPQPTPMQPMSQPLPSLAMQQQAMNYSVPASQGYPQVSSVPSSSHDVRSVIAADRIQESIPAPTAALLESLAEVTATGDEQPAGEDPESASGASAVAIDNKIEQAMDLVKSHLMFAVREEVEVLKEKIAELMERITQLESENTVLRASANPDTLAQLSTTQSSQASNPP